MQRQTSSIPQKEKGRVDISFFSGRRWLQELATAETALSCASTILPSPPTIAMTETDFGALRVTSRPGRCLTVPSGSLRPSRRPPGTSPSSTRRNACGSTGPESPSASAPRPVQALASRCAPSSFSKYPTPCAGEAILPMDATIGGALHRARESRILAGPYRPDMHARAIEQGPNRRDHTTGAARRRMTPNVLPAKTCMCRDGALPKC